MTTATALEVHPLAELIPPMTDDEFAELLADIATNGLLDPVTLYEDKILDGRHRARACEELGKTPATTDFTGDDPAEFVISKNLHRRHLSTGQRAHAALAFLDYEKEKAKERQRAAGGDKTASAEFSISAPEHKVATAEAGKKFGTSRDSVEKARALAESRPDLSEKVKRGEITLNAAVEENRGRPTNGRGRPATFSVDSERNRQVAEKARLRFREFVARLDGYQQSITEDPKRLERALAVTDEPEIREWLQVLKKSTKAFNQLKKALQEEVN